MNMSRLRSFEFYAAGSALLTVLLAAGIGSAEATIRVELTFDPPSVSQREDGSAFVATPDCVTFNQPGLPLLPARGAVVLLPPGETVTAIRVRTEGGHAIEGIHRVAPAQEPVPISLPGPYLRTEPDPAVYGVDALYPSAAARLVTEQKGWGHGLAFLRVFPVAYRPRSGALSWHERVIVEVDTALPEGADARSVPLLRNGDRAVDRLSRLVVNPEDLALYEDAEPAPLAVSLLEPDSYPYVIVTKAKFASAFQPVVELQSSRGLRARIKTIEEINGEYLDCRDPAEGIRQFLVDAYRNWGTEYVLLGGDVEVLKQRELYNADDPWDTIPGDCYFEGLDGTWNDDGDTEWGEPGEEDLVGEIAVGRVSASTEGEIANWRHKNEMYTEHPVVSQVEKALFLGEILNPYILTWGDDFLDEIQDGADTCGYTTVGYPADYDRRTLYDRDGTWDKYDLIPLINEGFPTVHHVGHSYTTYNMRMEIGDLAYLTNDGVGSSYMLNYTIGCYAGAFDEDSICEAFVNDPHGSAASVCNSRYGWYSPGTTCGHSHHFHRQFVDARYGEGIVTAGRMNVDSKTDLVWMLDDYTRYVHYELNLLGDPAIPQWGSVLGNLALQHDGKLMVGRDYTVTVLADGVPVPGAIVTLYSQDFSVWTSGETDENGVVVLHPDVRKSMTLYLKAVKAEFLPGTDSLRSIRK